MNINAYRARTCGILLPWCLLISQNFPCWIFWGLEKYFVSQLSLTLRRPRFLALWHPRFLIRQSVLLETYAVYLRFRRIYTTDSRSEAPNCIRFFSLTLVGGKTEAALPIYSVRMLTLACSMPSRWNQFRIVHCSWITWRCSALLLVQARCAHL